MKLFFFITILIFSLSVVISISNKGQIVIDKNDSLIKDKNRPIQKKIIGNGHNNDDLDTDTTVEWFSCSSADSVLLIDEIRL